MVGEANPMFGKPQTTESKIKKAVSGRIYTDEQITEAYIRAHSGKETLSKIADDLDISPMMVSHIKRGTRNADITSKIILIPTQCR